MRRGSSVVRIALAIILVEDSPTCVGDMPQESDALAINLVGQRALFVAPRCCDINSGKMRASRRTQRVVLWKSEIGRDLEVADAGAQV